MPIFEFDELQGSREVDGKKLIDYWGIIQSAFLRRIRAMQHQRNTTGKE